MIKERHISFEIAKLLKEKGFNIPCRLYYDYNGNSCYDRVYDWNNSPMGDTSAPSLYMTMEWLRENGIHISPNKRCFRGSKPKDKPYFLWEPTVMNLQTFNIIYPQPLDWCEHYKTYEEAVEAAILYSLENLI